MAGEFPSSGRSGWLLRLLVLFVLVVGLGAGVVAFAVHRATQPADRGVGPKPDLLFVELNEVEFPTSDGLQLRGWWIDGRPDAPAIVLCHDRGRRRDTMLDLALAIRDRGYNILLFDFRAHGMSDGDRSTLGVRESRDVDAAIDYVQSRRSGKRQRIGLFGAGMGAYASVLGATARPEVEVLVLDGLYPDMEFALERTLGTWMAAPPLSPLRNLTFSMFGGGRTTESRAADRIAELAGRNILFLAPAGDSSLEREIREMYADVPARADSDGNLVVLPELLGDGLFGAVRDAYHHRVIEFFVSRLPPEAPPVRA